MSAKKTKEELIEREIEQGTRARVRSFFFKPPQDPKDQLSESARLALRKKDQEKLIDRISRGGRLAYPDADENVLSEIANPDIDIKEERRQLKNEIHPQSEHLEVNGKKASRWQLRRISGSRLNEPTKCNSMVTKDTAQDDPLQSLKAAVDEARAKRALWKTKNRIRDGSVQHGFNKLCKNLDGYANILTLLPDNEYTSLVCGALKIMVKTSATYLRVSEDLDDALDDIYGYMAICQQEMTGLEPESVQQALNTFIARLLRYLTYASRWFSSCSAKKILDCASTNFQKDLDAELQKVARSAGLFQILCRMTREKWRHEQYLERFQELKHGQQSIKQQVADAIRDYDMRRVEEHNARAEKLSHAEGVKLALLYQQQLQIGAAAQHLLVTNVQADLYEPLFARPKEQLEGIEAQRFVDLDTNTLPWRPTVIQHAQDRLQTWSAHLEDYTIGTQTMLYLVDPPYVYTDYSIIEAVDEWSQPGRSAMTWVHGQYEADYPSSASATAKRVIEFSMELDIPVIFFFCEIEMTSDSSDDDDVFNRDVVASGSYYHNIFIGLIYSLIRQLVDVLGPTMLGSMHLHNDHFAHLDGTFGSLDHAFHILEKLLVINPRTLAVVIDGLDRIADRGLDDELTRLLALLQQAYCRGSSSSTTTALSSSLSHEMSPVLKIFFTTAGPCHLLEESVDPEKLVYVPVAEKMPREFAKREGILSEDEESL